MRVIRETALVLALLSVSSAPASATPTITELGGLSGPAGGIAAGPDGALWVTEAAHPGRIARMTPAGAVTEYTGGATPGFSNNRQPSAIAAGPDGALWFAEGAGSGFVGRITTAGVVSEVGGGSQRAPTSIARGPDGNLWVTEPDGDGAITRITPSGDVTRFTAGLIGGADPDFITAGSQDTLWFTDAADKGGTGRITTSGLITQSSAGITPYRGPAGIAAGPDGAAWFAESGSRGAIGRLPAFGPAQEFTDGLTPKIGPTAIAPGPDDALWFTAKDAIGRITTDGVITEYRAGLTPGPAGRGIVAGPDGAMWFTLAGTARLGRITVPPRVAAAVAEAKGPTAATVTSAVRPNGSQTSYHVLVQDAAGPVLTGTDLSAGAGTADVAVSFSVDGLTPSTTYTARVVATSGAGTTTGLPATFTTPAAGPGSSSSSSSSSSAAPSSAPRPVLGQSVVLRASRGRVRIKARGQSAFTALTATSTVSVGTLVDTRSGAVRLESALPGAKTQGATFHGGQFQVRQDAKRRGLTDLVLRGALSCGAAKAHSSRLAHISRRPRSRRLWARDHGGLFRTQGRDSVATVRGTSWLTVDRCGGTLVRVIRGAVAVRDHGAGKAVVVKAGGRHFTPHR